MPLHEKYTTCRFSIRCHSDDLAVVHCLRSLCQHNSPPGRKNIGWGGTKESDWREAGNKITLRFYSAEAREAFVQDAQRLLPQGSWQEVAPRRNNDPASPQR